MKKLVVIFSSSIVIVVLMILIFSWANKSSGTTTFEGEFQTTKGCMGVVNDVLLLEFSNHCDEAEKFDGKTVEVTGRVKQFGKCPDKETDLQQIRCDAMVISKVESIKIIR